MNQKEILIGFEKWLQILGFASSTVYTSVGFVKDFFEWLELNKITIPINTEITRKYYNYLQTRKNKRLGGALSQNTITSHINALKRLSKYLQETGKQSFEIDLQTPTEKSQTITVLTKKEVQKLYNACDSSLLGIRDKALLDIYYGCGLRRSEGISLDATDILLKEKLVHVRKGKGYKERYVPITRQMKERFEFYLETARKTMLITNNSIDHGFFIGITGKRIGGMTAITRIKRLGQSANIIKPTGLHTLRHSIATHLLQSGMDMEDVSRFLGHSSLESTQVYTHVRET